MKQTNLQQASNPQKGSKTSGTGLKVPRGQTVGAPIALDATVPRQGRGKEPDRGIRPNGLVDVEQRVDLVDPLMDLAKPRRRRVQSHDASRVSGVPGRTDPKASPAQDPQRAQRGSQPGLQEKASWKLEKEPRGPPHLHSWGVGKGNYRCRGVSCAPGA